MRESPRWSDDELSAAALRRARRHVAILVDAATQVDGRRQTVDGGEQGIPSPSAPECGLPAAEVRGGWQLRKRFPRKAGRLLPAVVVNVDVVLVLPVDDLVVGDKPKADDAQGTLQTDRSALAKRCQFGWSREPVKQPHRGESSQAKCAKSARCHGVWSDFSFAPQRPLDRAKAAWQASGTPALCGSRPARLAAQY